MSITLLFRNVDVDENDPVGTWPTEAIATALERGSLRHWSRLAAEIRSDPWGRVARAVDEVLTDADVYGVGPGMRRVLDLARAEHELLERRTVTAELAGLVEASGTTAGECATRLGTSASRLSTYLSGKVVPSATFMVRARLLLGPVL